MTQPIKAVRGRFLHCLDDPEHDIAATAKLPKNCELIDHQGQWIVPGFVETHVHYP